AARPNLARAAPALGLNCADWASKTVSGRPRRSDGRRDDRPDSRVLAESERSVAGWFHGRPAWSGGEDLADGFSAGRGTFFPGSDGCIGRGTRTGCAAARPCFPARALWSCAAWRERLKLGRPRDNVSRVALRDRPNGFDFGRDFSRTEYGFGRARNIRSSASRTARSGADSRYSRLEQPSLFWL
ncbi:unnamed protein product, partial [Microthlaspi erraticum]